MSSMIGPGLRRFGRPAFDTSVLRAGLGFDRCDVAVVTNIAEGDHLGIAGIDTPEGLAVVKRTVVELVRVEEEYEDLPKEVKAEPIEALVGGTNVHRRLVEQASRWLAPGGWLVVEIGAAQGPEVAALAEEALVDVEILPDLVGRDRVVRGRKSTTGPFEAPGLTCSA